MAIEKTRNDIIGGALEEIGVKAADESAQADDVQVAAKWLDWMVKAWQATGAHLWTRTDATLFLVTGQAKYVIGSTADATETFTETTTTSALVTGNTVIPIANSTGLAVNDFLAVKLDDGTLTFSVVTSISPVTITDGLASDAASGSAVFFYRTKLGKALKIPDARRRQSSQDIEMVQLGRIDYLNLPNKEQQGTPVQFYYDPKINTGDLFLWPTPQTTDTIIKFTFYKPIDIFDTSNDEADFPNEWLLALTYNLAVILAAKFSQPLQDSTAVLALKFYQDALDWDQGDASIFFAYGEGRGQ